jgi:Carboxypeptidase regulatory-like domain/TonB-dependent Receptor Plug Domain
MAQTPDLSPTRRKRFPAATCFPMLRALLPIGLLCLPCAYAQLAGKGEIKGTVKDPTGAVVPNATLTATESSTNVTLTRKTTSSGDYDMSPLDPGVYTIVVVASGFERQTQFNLHVNALEIQDFNPVLTVGTATENVTVSSAPPALETSNATLGATMENEMYSALPIQMGAYGQPDQRRATDFAFLMPGVQGNNTNGNATTNTGVVNGSGSRGAATAVYIDGLPFTQASGEGDPRFVWTAISVDAVNQFQVETSGYSALYEGQGVQNYTIKQGGNKFHASVYDYFRNTSLDTWGFFAPGSINPVVGHATKPEEHQNEYGVTLSGPIWKQRAFFFGSYDGYRFSHGPTPSYQTAPTAAEMNGDFSALGVPIYDPNTQTACTAKSTNGPCRYQYGYSGGAGTGLAGNPILTGAKNVIPAGEFSPVALRMQSFQGPLTNQNATNNQLVALKYGLTNWMTTNRVDFLITPQNTLTLVGAIGRQASTFPTNQTTSGRSNAPIPYNFGQAFAPKTAVGIVEDTHVFSANLVNQFKAGFARYNGPTFNTDEAPAYAATAMGITGLPTGQAQDAFPFVTFAGTDAPTNWAGEPASVSIANSYALIDNVQWVFGKHSLTMGLEMAWLQYQVTGDTTGTSPVTLATAVTETAAITPSSNSAPKYAATAGTGLSYASFLVGQIDKGSLTQNLVQETGARFRPISPYFQDDWKVTSRLTLNLGLRYDFYPTYSEAHNVLSFFNPTLINPVTGLPGAIQFAGSGANTCNCSTPVNNYYKNFGPRIGFAFQSGAKTVWRGSWGVMYTHGNGVGGAANSRTGTGILGFSATPSFSANGFLLSTFPLGPGNSAFPSYPPALGTASGTGFGTGYTTVSGYTGTPSTIGYGDPYQGGRAPQYINWSFGFQHQWASDLTSSISYVGSQGHFLITDGGNPRGYWADALDPKYLSLGSNLSLTGPAMQAFCVANNLPCPPAGLFTTSQPLSQALKPFPFSALTDTYGNVANSSYNALQISVMKRASHGVMFMANYTWSRTIDDGGTFRTGYPIPAAFSQNGKSWAADAIERGVSTSNQPQHFVLTGVWDLPFGRTILTDTSYARAILGGFKFSTIFQAYSGSPLAILGSACGTNPAQTSTACEPTLSPGYRSVAHINGAWGSGVTAANVTQPFIDSAAFVQTPSYVFGNAPRTAPYNLYGPGNYDLDISLRRTFGLGFEGVHLTLQGDLYNVTNHTQFGGIGTTFGSSSFGTVSSQANASRDAQLMARFEF